MKGNRQKDSYLIGAKVLRTLAILIMLVPITGKAATFEHEIIKAAHKRTKHTVKYDGTYLPIPYPGGDVPDDTGVCTDVIIRSYRQLGTDLQKLVHEDMAKNFSLYPSRRIWGLNTTDTNIDHRRVPNLRVFFMRHGETLTVSSNPGDYKPGDLVTWMLPGNRPHIGIVTDTIDPKSGNPLVIHNVGRGPKHEDALFMYNITGHYKYVPDKYRKQR